MKVETVIIDTKAGAVVINKADFIDGEHKLFIEKKPRAKTTKKARKV